MASYGNLLGRDLPYPLCFPDDSDLRPSEQDDYQRGQCGIPPEGDEINVVILETHANGPETTTLNMKTISELGNYLESREDLLTWPASGCALPPGYESPSPPCDPLRIPLLRSDAPPPDHPLLSSPGRSSPSPPSGSFLFLVEDLSPKLVRLLGGYLSIPSKVFVQHFNGGETRYHRRHQGLKSHPSCKACHFNHVQRGRQPLGLETEISSLGWWSAGTYSSHMNSMVNQVRDEPQYPFERIAWKQVTIPPAAALGDDLDLPGVGRRLGCGIFRPFQVITELESHGGLEAYTCALEERVTSYMRADNCGTWLCLRIS